MFGKLMSTFVGMTVATFVILLIILLYNHFEIKLAVNEINYSVTESVSTSGIINEATYYFLRDNINKFGNYKIIFKLEKRIKQGVYDTYFDNNTEIDQALSSKNYTKIEVLNRGLQEGDRITIYIEDNNQTMFGRLINSTMFFWQPNKFLDLNIKSKKSAIISKSRYNIEKGYDVITSIKNYQSDSTVAIQVITKMNKTGKFYGYNTHPYVVITNPVYGDDIDEVGNTGVNYIFDNGDFKKEIEYYPSGAIKFIKYIQQ